jgi:hypothetical protein
MSGGAIIALLIKIAYFGVENATMFGRKRREQADLSTARRVKKMIFIGL